MAGIPLIALSGAAPVLALGDAPDARFALYVVSAVLGIGSLAAATT